MTPKEKAQQLISNFKKFAYYPQTDNDEIFVEKINHNARQCALVCVDEILSLRMCHAMGRDDKYSESEFWEKVKEEINNYK